MIYWMKTRIRASRYRARKSITVAQNKLNCDSNLSQHSDTMLFVDKRQKSNLDEDPSIKVRNKRHDQIVDDQWVWLLKKRKKSVSYRSLDVSSEWIKEEVVVSHLKVVKNAERHVDKAGPMRPSPEPQL